MSALVGDIWKIILLQPVINVLIVLTHFLSHNFGLAIIALTLISKLVTHPLNMRQLRSTRAMQEIQPKLAELQKKYARDRQKLLSEQMALYRENGISPTGCLGPLLLQMPVFFVLYQAINRILAIVPEDFLSLSQYLYSWPIIYSQLPLPHKFLWLDLALPDRFYVLPILVGITMWIQQKMIATESPDPKQQAQQRVMLWSMPMMFTVFTISFPSGLALYWVVSSIISIVTQYFVTGWGGLTQISIKNPFVRDNKRVKRTAQATITAPVTTETAPAGEEQKEGLSDEESRGKRQDRGGSGTKRPGAPRRQPRRYKGHRSKRR